MVRTGLGHGGITCVLQTQFSSLHCSVSSFVINSSLQFSMNVYQTLQTNCGHIENLHVGF